MNLSLKPDSNIPPRWLPFLRAVWIACALLLLTLFILDLPLSYAELSQTCIGEACALLALSPDEAAMLQGMGVSLKFYAGFQVGAAIYLVTIFSLLAFLTFWRKADSWIGFIVSLAFLFIGIIFFEGAARVVVVYFPAWAEWGDFLTAVSIILFILLLYLFPDGRFAPRWFSYLVAIHILIVLLEPNLFPNSPAATSADTVVVIAAMSGIVLGVASQIYRYRRVSTRIQRQQTKWVLYGFLIMFAAMMVWIAFGEFSSLPVGRARLAFNFSVPIQNIFITAFPITFVISILRYRLWDIDLIIRKTVQYGVVTAVLALAYLGTVLLLQSLIGRAIDEQSPLVVVLSTLLIAALFTPLRRRIQTVIDRRFFRKKYDAAQVLAQFAQTARDETNMEVLQAELLRVVQETMQPNQVSIWLKE
jgi:hypothetical protein